MEKSLAEEAVWGYGHTRDWDYVSHWKLINMVMVRRVCKGSRCGRREVAAIAEESWEVEHEVELSSFPGRAAILENNESKNI